MRKIVFANDEYYHVFNRGVDKRKIFLRVGHYKRFIQTLENLLNFGSATTGRTLIQKIAFTTKISFISYCLMPNHYHFIIRQIQENGISEFMHHLNTSYTKYFNINEKRSGRLFEFTFKAVHVDSEAQLLHLSRYIHINPLLAGVVEDLNKYTWSSYQDFIGLRDSHLCQKQEILDLISLKKSPQKYQDFVVSRIKHAQALKNIILE